MTKLAGVNSEYNEVETEKAQKADAVVSHDNDLEPVGREGKDLAASARPNPFDPGDVTVGESAPKYPGSDAQLYQAPPSNLPTTISTKESLDYSIRLTKEGDLV